jgi:hypothetical protein
MSASSSQSSHRVAADGNIACPHPGHVSCAIGTGGWQFWQA